MPRKADPKLRARLLAAARDRFLENGYAATGIDEICTTASVTKGVLFHHFGTKEGLALAVLGEWVDAGAKLYDNAPFLDAKRAYDRALGYIDYTIDLVRQAPIGCLIGTMAIETSQTNPQLCTRCAKAFQDWGAVLAVLLENAQREAAAPADFDAASVARHFIAVFEGAQLLAKTNQDKEVTVEHLLHFRSYLVQLLGTGPGLPQRPHKSRHRGRKL